MIMATVNAQCTTQTLGSDNRYPGYYSKTHLAQSWQDNLFLWVQSRLECCSYDPLKERKKQRHLSRGSISGSSCRQSSNRLQRSIAWGGGLDQAHGGITSKIMLPSTFGGLANANISDTSLNRWKKKCEIAWRFACKRNLRIPGKAFNIRSFISYSKRTKRVIGLWSY